MFRRLGRIDADKLLTEYIEDRVFLLLSPALRKLSVQYNDLNPVEVWQEARTVTERLVQFSSRRDVLIDVVYPELLEQYQHFESVDGNIVDRLEEQAKRSADMVLTAVSFMLMCTAKEGENPHQPIMERLRSVLQQSETARYIIAQAEENEVKEEKQYGEIPEHDYLHVPDKMDGPRQMLLLPKDAGCVDLDHVDKYAFFIDALLDNVCVQAFLLGSKTLRKEFNAKGVYGIAGLLIMKKILDTTPNALSKKYGNSNSNKWMSPKGVDEILPKNIKDIVKQLIKEHFEKKSSC